MTLDQLRRVVLATAVVVVFGARCDTAVDDTAPDPAAEQTLQGKWLGTRTFGSPPDELRFELDLTLEPDGPVVLGGGWIGMGGIVDTTIAIDVSGTVSDDSLLVVAFEPATLQGVISGYSGRLRADSIHGQLTLNAIFVIAPPPVLLDLGRVE